MKARALVGATAVGAAMWAAIIGGLVAACGDTTPAANGVVIPDNVPTFTAPAPPPERTPYDNHIPGTYALTTCDHGNRLYQPTDGQDMRPVIIPADPSCKGQP